MSTNGTKKVAEPKPVSAKMATAAVKKSKGKDMVSRLALDARLKHTGTAAKAAVKEVPVAYIAIAGLEKVNLLGSSGPDLNAVKPTLLMVQSGRDNDGTLLDSELRDHVHDANENSCLFLVTGAAVFGDKTCYPSVRMLGGWATLSCVPGIVAARSLSNFTLLGLRGLSPLSSR